MQVCSLIVRYRVHQEVKLPYPNDDNQLDLYQHYGSQNDFVILPGVCILPLAEDPDTNLVGYSPVVIARLHAPYRIRKYNYKSDKLNNPPPTPEWGDSGKFIFVGGTVSVGNTLNATYSNFDWQTGTEFMYVENCAIRSQDGLVLGTPPFNQQTSNINAQTFSNFPPTPYIGAISYAGIDAITGYWQGQAILESQNSTGKLREVWGYNVSSFYPGTLFFSDLINGGPTTTSV